MNTEREESILRMLANGGLSDHQVARLESDLHELQASREREREWSRLTEAPIQPRWRHADPWT
jgi:hypothetical protein